MYPTGWPDELHFAGSVYTYSADTEKILSALALSTQADTTAQWVSALAYPMTSESQQQVIKDLTSREHPLTCLGLTILCEKIAQKALGIELFSAAALSAVALRFWFPFASWAATKGLNVQSMPPHLLLQAVYGWQAMGESYGEDAVKAKNDFNRRVFGKKNPWG